MLANNLEKSDITIGSPPVLSHNTHRFLLSSSFSPKEPKKGHHKPYAYSTDMEYNRRFVLGNLNRHTVHSYKCIGGINALKGTNRKLTAISFSVPKTSADFLAIDFAPLADKPFGHTNLTSVLKENQPDFSTNNVPLSQQNDLSSPATNTETETGDHVKIRHHQSGVSHGDHTAGPKKSQLISSTALPLYETDGNILIMTNNAGPSSSVLIGSPKLVSESNSSNRSSSQNIQSVDGITQTIAPKTCDDQTINTDQHVLPQNENVDQTTAFEKYNDPKITSVEFGLLHSSDDLDSSAAEDELLNDPPSYKCVAPITQTMLKYCPDYVTTNTNITTITKPSKTETADIETRDDAILEKVTYVLTLHPKYFEKFYRMHNFLLKGNFSLSYADRHFIALMAVSCYNCRPLMVNQMREFINSGGDMDWLFDSEAIPQKMKNLFEINKLLAHQPWRIDRALIKHVMRNDPPQNNWNPGELVFAITLLTHFQGLCSLVFGCAWLYDLTQQAFHATLTQLYGDYRKKHGLYNISGEGLTKQSNKNSLLTDTPLSYPLQTSNINPNSSTPLLNRKVLLVSTPENENLLIETAINDDLQLNTVDEGEDCLEAFEEVTVDALITKMKVLHQKIRAQDLDFALKDNGNEMFPPNSNIEMAQDVNTISPATPSSQKAIDIALAMTVKPEPPQTTINYTFESTLETTNVIKNPNFNVLLSSPQSGITSDEDNTTTNSSCPSSLLLQFDETNLRRTNNFKDETRNEDWRNKLKRDGSNLTEVLDLVKASTFISADETFSYVDFAKRDYPSQAPTFRIQDYSWEHHGYALVNRLCPELSNLLDDKFRMAYHLTYSTMGCVSNVDTSMFRRAIWNYIHSAYGIRHDDYDYSQVNQLLTRNLKMVIKTLTCYPQRILAPTFCDACYNIVIHNNKENKNENYDKMENKGKKSPKLFRIESVPETSLNNNHQSFATKIEQSFTNPPHGNMNKNKKSGQTHSTNTKKRGKKSNNVGNEGTKSSPLSKRSSSSTSSSLEFCIKEGFMRDFLESEKVHVNLMIMDAKIQAANLYALRAIMQFMS